MCTLIRCLGFMGTFKIFFFNTHLYCLLGCLSTTVWTKAVLGVLDACVLNFSIAHVQRSWACFTWKGALDICSLLLLSLSVLCCLVGPLTLEVVVVWVLRHSAVEEGPGEIVHCVLLVLYRLGHYLCTEVVMQAVVQVALQASTTVMWLHTMMMMMTWVGVKNFGFTEKQKNIEQGSTKLKELHVCIMRVQKKMAAKLKELHVCIMHVQKKMAAWWSEVP